MYKFTSSEILPHSWTVTTLSDVAEINPLINFAQYDDDTLISFVPMPLIEELTGRLDSTRLEKLGKVKKGYTRFLEGDVLFAKITPCMENGKVAVAENLKGGIGAGSTELHVLRPRGEISNRYILYYLLQNDFRGDAQHHMTGMVGQKRVPSKFIESSEIPLPPLNEQRRIVSKIEELFSRLDEGEAALMRVLRLLTSYRQAVLRAAVTGELTKEWRDTNPPCIESGSDLLERILAERKIKWEAANSNKQYRPPTAPDVINLPSLPDGWCWATVDQLTCHITSGSRGWAERYSTEGAIFIRAQDIKTDRLVLDSIAHVNAPQNVESERTRVQQYDLLVTITGANVTKTALVTQELDNAYVNQHVAIVRSVVSDISQYLYYWIVSPANGRKILERLAYGAGKPGLNLTNIRELVIAFPPAAEQTRIVSELDNRISVVDSLSSVLKQEFQRAKIFRQSILKAAFSGQLVEQDPTDEPASVLMQRIHSEWQTPTSKPTACPLSKEQGKRTPKQQPSLWEPT